MLRLGATQNMKQVAHHAPNGIPSRPPALAGRDVATLSVSCRAFMRRNGVLPGFRYTSSCHAASCRMPRAFHYDRHPEVPGSEKRGPSLKVRSSGKPVIGGATAGEPPQATGRSSFEGSHTLWRLRMTVCLTGGARLVTVWHSSDPHSLHRHIIFPFLPSSHHLSFPRGVRRADHLVSLCRPPNEGGGGAPQGAHWVFDHAGEARCRVNGTRRSRCDRDRAPRRSTVAISGRGTTLQLRQCPPDPRCDLPAGPSQTWPTGSRTSRAEVRFR